ncbi:MAG: hypothetical protein R6V85_05235 [Polyangia bacterium]
MSAIRKAIPILFLGLSFVLGACADDDDTGGGDDTDTDTGSDTGTGECVAPFEWGGAWEQGQVVGNWTFSGYVDGDGDGVVEEELVEFDMDYIHCQGKQSIVLTVADTT